MVSLSILLCFIQNCCSAQTLLFPSKISPRVLDSLEFSDVSNIGLLESDIILGNTFENILVGNNGDFIEEKQEISSSKEELVDDTLIVMEAVFDQELRAAKKELEKEMHHIEFIDCGNNISSLPAEMLHEFYIMQQEAIGELKTFMEVYVSKVWDSLWKKMFFFDLTLFLESCKDESI